ncbi:WGR domain-containing protein [Niallia sp. XMNu-256]|uniref:WGR domain-containing protein n=1 Tax=Niallia sp. XMNu-256 TaxID=3082444 RepID=UPI0030D140A2
MTKLLSPRMKNLSSFSVKQVEQRVVLNYVRIQTNSNKFYIMEFQEGEGEFSYRIFIEYGRMGSPPRRHERYFQSRLETREAFDRILNSKRKKGYELILIEEEWENDCYIQISGFTPKNIIYPNDPSPTLPSHTTPFGKLSEIQIHRGLLILTEIEKSIQNERHDVIDLSNKFYSLIPVAFGSSIDRNYILDTMTKVQEKKEWLNQMINDSTIFK